MIDDLPTGSTNATPPIDHPTGADYNAKLGTGEEQKTSDDSQTIAASLHPTIGKTWPDVIDKYFGKFLATSHTGAIIILLFSLSFNVFWWVELEGLHSLKYPGVVGTAFVILFFFISPPIGWLGRWVKRKCAGNLEPTSK